MYDEVCWLKVYRETLVKELDLNHSFIIDYLFIENVLSEEDGVEVRKAACGQERNALFLDILQDKGESGCHLFIDALTKHQPHLIHRLHSLSKMADHAEDSEKGFEELSVKEFKAWLKPRLEQDGLPLTILDVVTKLQIDGKVFISMSDSEIREEFSDIVFGHRKKLTLIRDEIISEIRPEKKLDAKDRVSNMEPADDFGLQEMSGVFHDSTLASSEGGDGPSYMVKDREMTKSIEERPCQEAGSLDISPAEKAQKRSKPPLASSAQRPQSKPKVSQQTLQKKLRDFLCGAGKKVDGSFFPLLATAAVEDENMKESFEFVSRDEWSCVLDFDATLTLYDYVENDEQVPVKVKTFDDFMEEGATGGFGSQTQDNVLADMSASDFINWVFCNGYEDTEEEKLEIAQWKKERSKGFHEVVRYFEKNIPLHRARLVILVTSEDKVFIEACEGLLLGFQEQWLMIAESEEFAEAWIEGLKKRDVEVDPKRCLYGCSFVDVNRVILQLMKGVATSTPDHCTVNTSLGSRHTIPKKKLRELCDLDIVSQEEWHNAVANMFEDELKQEQEDLFYRGNRATWWNFYFEGHVCERDKLEELTAQVRGVLAGDVRENVKVDTVTLFHQPGAGGTTLAMNVLWNLQRDFKCCLVKRITPSTAGQILELFKQGESNPKEAKPVLAMVDNENDLAQNIIESCSEKEIQKLVCVLLVCKRQTSAPYIRDDGRAMFLEQKLSTKEKQFFTDKYAELEEKDPGNVHNLLGLNILKEDFSVDYIKRTVAKFVEAIRDDHHKTVLKYTALLNCYDLDFRGIPISCFDPFLYQEQGQSQGKLSVVQFMQQGLWEDKLNPEPLMIFTTNKQAGRNKCLRVSNLILCPYIVDKLFQNGSHGHLMEEILTSEMFQGKYRDVNFRELVSIIAEVLKKRGMDETGQKRSRFSKFIQKLLDEQEVEQGIKCMEIVYKKNGDAFLAQQIARIFIAVQDFVEAERWARTAVERKSNNSFLWDTLGQIYKWRLNELRFDWATKPEPPDDDVIVQAVKLGHEGCRVFQKEEELSQQETLDVPNTAGLFGQIEIVWQLSNILKLLPYCASKEDLSQMLSGEKHFPEEFQQIPDIKQHLKWLQTLQELSYNCLADAENRKMEFDINLKHSSLPAKYFLGQENINRCRTKLNGVFFQEYAVRAGPVSTLRHGPASTLRPGPASTLRPGPVSTLRPRPVSTLRPGPVSTFRPGPVNTLRPGPVSTLRPEPVSTLRPGPVSTHTNSELDERQERIRALAGNNLYSIMDRFRCGKEGKATALEIFHLASLNVEEKRASSFFDLQMALASGLTLISCHDGPLEVGDCNNLLKWSLALYQRQEVQTPNWKSRYITLDPYVFLMAFHWPMPSRNSPVSQCTPEELKGAMELAQQLQGRSPNFREPNPNKPFLFLTNKAFNQSIISKGRLQALSGNKNTERKISNILKSPAAAQLLQRFYGNLKNSGKEVRMTLSIGQATITHVTIPLLVEECRQTLWNKKVHFALGIGTGGPLACDVEAEPTTQLETPLDGVAGDTTAGATVV